MSASAAVWNGRFGAFGIVSSDPRVTPKVAKSVSEPGGQVKPGCPVKRTGCSWLVPATHARSEADVGRDRHLLLVQRWQGDETHRVGLQRRRSPQNCQHEGNGVETPW